MQQDQVKGMIDRAIAVLATMLLGWMVRKGWLGESDAATLTPALILLPALAWGWWNNRDKALVQSAANVPNTVVITSPALAQDTPDQKNIVSNALTPASIANVVKDAKSVSDPKEPL